MAHFSCAVGIHRTLYQNLSNLEGGGGPVRFLRACSAFASELPTETLCLPLAGSQGVSSDMVDEGSSK